MNSLEILCPDDKGNENNMTKKGWTGHVLLESLTFFPFASNIY